VPSIPLMMSNFTSYPPAPSAPCHAPIHLHPDMHLIFSLPGSKISAKFNRRTPFCLFLHKPNQPYLRDLAPVAVQPGCLSEIPSAPQTAAQTEWCQPTLPWHRCFAGCLAVTIEPPCNLLAPAGLVFSSARSTASLLQRVVASVNSLTVFFFHCR